MIGSKTFEKENLDTLAGITLKERGQNKNRFFGTVLDVNEEKKQQKGSTKSFNDVPLKNRIESNCKYVNQRLKVLKNADIERVYDGESVAECYDPRIEEIVLESLKNPSRFWAKSDVPDALNLAEEGDFVPMNCDCDDIPIEDVVFCEEDVEMAICNF